MYYLKSLSSAMAELGFKLESDSNKNIVFHKENAINDNLAGTRLFIYFLILEIWEFTKVVILSTNTPKFFLYFVNVQSTYHPSQSYQMLFGRPHS
jgi:hypothetical protein